MSAEVSAFVPGRAPSTPRDDVSSRGRPGPSPATGRRRIVLRHVLVAAVAVLLATTACSAGSSSPSSSVGAPAGSSASSPTGGNASPTSDARSPSAVDARCSYPLQRKERVGSIRARDGSVLPMIEIGDGPTAVVYLHQTDGDGLCAWLPFAAWVSGRGGTHAVLVDLCGFGRAACTAGPFDQDQPAQVSLVVAHARALPGIRRVVVVGASMGGALAFAAAAHQKLDAVIDLSGPPGWAGADSAPAAPHIRAATLVVSSPGDTTTDFRALRAAFARIPSTTPKRLVVGDGPHGIDLLGGTGGFTPIAQVVAAWITGSAR